MHNQKNNLVKSLMIVVLSIVIAVTLVKTEVLKNLLTSTQELKFIGSFVAGVFFTSGFTIAPATVVLAEIAQTNSIFWVAFFGGIGALMGDLVIFRFIKDRLSGDFLYLIRKSKSERLISIFRPRLFKWIVPFVGALVIISPLPDELGLTMIGFSKVKTFTLIPIIFSLKFLGILIVGLIAKAL